MGPSYTNTVAKGKRPTLSTLFEPGYYLIQRGIMMHLDEFSFRNLKVAVLEINEDFHYNLKHYATEPQWVCQEDKHYPYARSYVHACEGFKLNLPSGKVHGLDYGICMKCSERGISSWPLLEDKNEVVSARTIIPPLMYKRLDKDSPPPSEPCHCASDYSKLHLCNNCRLDMKKRYHKTAMKIARKSPNCIEYIISYEPQSSKTHVIDPNSSCCHKCQQAYEEWRPFKSERMCPLYTFKATHTTGEPLQTLQCLSCKGSIRGVIVVGPGAEGDHARFGAGRGMRNRTELPWLASNPIMIW